MPTLLDTIVKINATEPGIIVNEAARPVPEIAGLNSARTISGLKYTSLVVEELPRQSANGDGFIDVGDGVDASDVHMVNREFRCFPTEARIEGKWSELAGYPGGIGGYFDDKSPLILRGRLMDIASDFYYADRSAGQKGFDGLATYLNTLGGMVVNAGGDTATGCTSVYAVRWGELDGMSWMLGEDGMLGWTEIMEGLLSGNNSKQTKGYWRTMTAQIGLARKSIYATGRLCNIDNTKTLTDDLLDKLYAAFPTGFKPTAFYLNRRTIMQLKASRTATNATGAPAPWPTVYEAPEGNIPLILTESIIDTEAVVS